MKRIKEFLRIIFQNRQSAAGMIILGFFFIMAVLGPVLVDEPKTNYAERLQLPSFKHLLGTDYAGRDTLAQFVIGSRSVLVVALLAAFFAILIAITIGIFSGTIGGKTDAVLMMITNVVLTVPSFPVMMVLSMVMEVTNYITFGLVLSIWSWAGLAKAIRSQVLSIKNRDFIEASRILGLSTYHIVTREILPNIMSYVAMNFILIMRGAIIASVGLMVLGLVPFSGSHWGMMIQMATATTGAMYGSSALFYFLVPVFGIMLFQMGCFFLGTGLDEAMNPRLRER